MHALAGNTGRKKLPSAYFTPDSSGELRALPRPPSWISERGEEGEKGIRGGKGAEGRERNSEGLDPHSVWDELTPMLCASF